MSHYGSVPCPVNTCRPLLTLQRKSEDGFCSRYACPKSAAMSVGNQIWNQIAKPQQLDANEIMKMSDNTSLEGQIIEMVQDIFGDNFIIAGGLPVFLAGRTKSFGDVNFLLPKCYAPDSLLTASNFNNSKYRSHSCDLNKKIKDIPAFEQELAIKTFDAVSRFIATRKSSTTDTTANTLSSTVAARLAKVNKVNDSTTWSGAIKVKTLANDYFSTKTNPHGPAIRNGERTVVLRPHLEPPHLVQRMFAGVLFEKGHGGFFWNNTDMKTCHERHLLHDDIRCTKSSVANYSRWSFEQRRFIHHNEMDDYEKFENYKKFMNTINHQDFDTFRGATIVTVKLRLDMVTGERESIRLFNLVFLEDVRALMNDKEYKCRTNNFSCSGKGDLTKEEGACVMKTCRETYLFRKIAGIFDDMQKVGKKRNLSPPGRRCTKRHKWDYISVVTNDLLYYGIDLTEYGEDSDNSNNSTSDEDDDDEDSKMLLDDNDDYYVVKKLLRTHAKKAKRYYGTGCIQCIIDREDIQESHALPSATLPVSSVLGERIQDGVVFPSGQDNILFNTLVDHVCNPVNLNICKHVLVPYRQKLHAVYLGATNANSLSNNSEFTVGDVRKYEKRVLEEASATNSIMSLADLSIKKIFYK